MLYIKALHIIAMVAWFAGLFYLPRLFVYHADTTDCVSLERFKIMERRLYYGITWPAGIATTVFGILLISEYPEYYLHFSWMHAKLALVFFVWVYHGALGYALRQFARKTNNKSAKFYRFFNEIPTVLLIGIVLLVVVKPYA